MTIEEQFKFLEEQDKELQAFVIIEEDIASQNKTIEEEANAILLQMEKDNNTQEEKNTVEQETLDEEVAAQEIKDKKEADEAIKNEESNVDKEKLKKLYPNKSAINRLKEPEVVALGKELGLEVNIDLKSSENKEIVASYFKKEIWN